MTVQVISGRVKNPGRPGYDMVLAKHAVVALPNRQGKRIRRLFGVRLDDRALGFVTDFNESALVPGFTSKDVDEKPMSLDGWFVILGGQNDHFARVEKLTEAADVALAMSEGAKPLGDYVVKA